MNSKWGFTLIELVITVTILAILAAVAIPIFGNLQRQARDAATRGALAAMREAIQQYRMNEILSGRRPGTPGSWPDNGCPSVSNLRDYEQSFITPKAMEGGIVPDNPWARNAGIIPPNENWIVDTPLPKGTLNTIISPRPGWLYNLSTCEIWANSDVNGGPITENNF